MARGLTDTQAAILRYVIERTELDGHAPTVREISARFGFRSTRGATVHLDALERKLHVVRTSASRGIRVLRDPQGQPVTLRYVPLASIVAPEPETQTVPR